MSEIDAITKDSVLAAVSEALYRHVGPRKRYSYERAAEVLGAEVRTVKSWVLGESVPCLYRALRLMCWLNGDVADQMLGCAGLQAIPVAHPDGDDFGLNRRMAETGYNLAEAFADGKVDHGERAALVPVVRAAHAQTSAWLAAHDDHMRAPAVAAE